MKIKIAICVRERPYKIDRVAIFLEENDLAYDYVPVGFVVATILSVNISYPKNIYFRQAFTAEPEPKT